MLRSIISKTFGLLVIQSLFLIASANAIRPNARFEPQEGKVLVFVGQDNASVGGTEKYTDGYVDNVGIPAGITHYVYFTEGWTNGFDYTFDEGTVDGLNKETTWGAGPMNMKAYADSPQLKDCIFHLSISMEGNSEDRVADGSYDHLIYELIDFLKAYSDRIFLIRIGYEFDGSWNDYDPKNFKGAFCRIVDYLRTAKVENFASVMACSGWANEETWEKYWPGDEYVDWVGYSYWGGDAGKGALSFARKKGKPAFIAESAPKGIFLDQITDPQTEAWEKWYTSYFEHIEKNLDVVRAISYINCNWDAQPMWDQWGNTRIEENDYIRNKWQEVMKKSIFINAKDKPAKLVTNW